MLSKVDFLFIYEHKVRELESLMILKNKLVEKGYSVELLNVWELALKKRKIPDTKVLVLPTCYNDNMISAYLYGAINNVDRIVNMQWEQIFSEAETNSVDSFTKISGIAKDMWHFSWGMQNVKFLSNRGVPTGNIKLVGPIQMDSLRSEFEGCHLKKDDLFVKYKIDPSKKVCLFISSFRGEDESEEQINLMLQRVERKEEYREFVKVGQKSQIQILNWMEKILNKRKDIIFIYRPHPAENIGTRIKSMMKYSNFMLIRDYTTRQWIKTADSIFLWYSTTIVEVFFADKNCSILRPLEIGEAMEIPLYQGTEKITTFEQFEDALIEPTKTFPINKKEIESYYSFSDTPAYCKYVDILEQLYVKSEGNIKGGIYNNIKLYGTRRILAILKGTILYSMYNRILDIISPMKSIVKCRKIELVIENHEVVAELYKKDFASKKEISDLQKKIEKILNDNV